jgi:predicted ATPase/class 3 adenylate cyclase/DNA-binding CsgD family transcriptional regulator
MPDLPSGTVTFLFADFEENARLRQRLGERYEAVLTEHVDALHAVFLAHGGHEVDLPGAALVVAFHRPGAAVAAAAAAQRALAAPRSPAGDTAPVRMGVHTGEPLRTAAGYIGLDVLRAARICAAGHGGQVLLSQVTAERVREDLPAGSSLRDLGEHRFKDLAHPERLFQLIGPGLRDDFPPPASLGSVLTNLPTPPTNLIDREWEVVAVEALLRRADVRLVTLTGPGGAGKTRVGLQVAADLLDNFRDGVFFVGLAAVVDPDLVIPSLALALGLRDAGERPIPDIVADFLRERQLLLVLDNFEQVLAAAPLVADLLASCPQIKLLVTSRAALHLRGEHEFLIPPLSMPDPNQLPPVAELTRYPAVALCVERARAIRSDFVVTEENAPALVQICRRLDGLPLAIELAAARIRILSPAAVLARLDRRLTLLTGGARDLPARQQTMRGTIAWSHELLTEAEQRLFRRMSVFAGGATIAAVEAVCADLLPPFLAREGEAGVGVHVLDGLAALVDHNLLRHEETDDEPRFVMLETIREYAVERLEASGEAAAVRTRHLRFYRGLAREAEAGLRGPEQLVWLERLEIELDNIRAALAWATVDSEAARDGLSLAAALTPFWWQQHLPEGRDWLERLLATGAAAGSPLRALALYLAGFLAHSAGGGDRAYHLVDESVALSRSLGLEQILGMALGMQATGAAYRGDLDAARAAADESVSILRRMQDPWALAITLGWHGRVAATRGDDATARASWEESIALFRSVGTQTSIASPISWLGDLAYRQGDYATARQRWEESVSLCQQAGNFTWAAHALTGLGLVALAENDPEGAESYFRESLKLPGDALRPLEVPPALVGIAAVGISRGQAERAARLLGAAEQLSSTVRMPLTSFFRELHERSTVAARAMLAEEAFATAWSAGQTMTLGQAVAYALMTEQPVISEPDTTDAAARAAVTGRRPAGTQIPGGLTAREAEVLGLVAAGHSSKEIAATLGVAVSTVNRHIANIYTKIGARGRADAIAYALRLGLDRNQAPPS